MVNDNKVVLITGASSGIGAALARYYTSKGFNTVIAARRSERLQKISAECASINFSVRAVTVKCDVTKQEDLDNVVNVARNNFGRLDTVIANAGFGVVGKFENLNLDDYKRQFEVNVWGVQNTVWASLDELKKTKGKLAIMGSGSSHFSLPGVSAYSMSKYSVRALAEALYFELMRYGISVTLICPGLVESEIRKVDNYGVYNPEAKEESELVSPMKTDKAARQIYSAVEKRKREVVITFHCKLLMFVNKYLPSVMSLLMKSYAKKL